MTTDTKVKDLSALLVQLDGAQMNLVEKQAAASYARNAETSALNKVNELQKKVDALIAEIKSKSPRESDWKRADR